MNNVFVCPKCKKRFSKVNNSLVCDNNHSFDISKHGYVNLYLTNSNNSGDDKEMCRCRHIFHNEDYYKCLSEKLYEICTEHDVTSVLDAGCGEGYYLRKIRDGYEKAGRNIPVLFGIDIAKEAVTIASKIEKPIPDNRKIKFAVAGIFDMPVENSSVDCVLSVFAPVADAEAKRVLKECGLLIIVSPGEKHLEGLKKAIYENVYDNEIHSNDYNGFELIESHCVSDTICVKGDNVRNLFHMTPYYWKTSVNDAEKILNLECLDTKIEFIIKIYKKI